MAPALDSCSPVSDPLRNADKTDQRGAGQREHVAAVRGHRMEQVVPDRMRRYASLTEPRSGTGQRRGQPR